MRRLALMEDLSMASFQPRVGSAFEIQLESSRVGLLLAECEPIKLSGPHPDRTPFRLIFHGPLQPILPQSIYQLTNETLGALAIFIVPIGPEGGRMQYEAVFT